MARVRLDQKKRKPLGFAVPDTISGRDAWERAEIKTDASTAPLPSEAPSEQKAKRHKAQPTPCPCHCLCGSKGADGSLCYLCSKSIHHVCGRACKEFQQERAMSIRDFQRQQAAKGKEQAADQGHHGNQNKSWLTEYIPPRAACGGGTYRRERPPF